jgi:hypothetical protein
MGYTTGSSAIRRRVGAAYGRMWRPGPQRRLGRDALAFIFFTLWTIGFTAAAQDETAIAPTLLNPTHLRISYDTGALQRQFDALNLMKLTELRYSPLGPVRSIQGDLRIVLPQSARRLRKGDFAPDVLSLIKDVLLATGDESVVVKKHYSTESPAKLSLSQSIDGIPVFTGGVAMSYDPTTLRVSSVSATFLPDRDLPRIPKLSASRAEQIVPESLAAAGQKDVSIEIRKGTHLAYFVDWWGGSAPALVWVVYAAVGSFHQKFLVDAATGEVVYKQNETSTLTTTLHDANSTSPSLPGALPPAMDPDQISIVRECGGRRSPGGRIHVSASIAS